MKENSREEDIEELKRFLYRDELTQYGKRKLINYYEQQEKDYKRVLKENESWKSYSEEIEEEQIEKNNKNCELEFEVEKLQKENEEVKRLIAHKNEYTKKLEEDLFENAENYVISKQKVKDKIEEILNNKEYRIVFEGNAEFPDDATIINAQKYIKLEKMQELIEEREEK